jgi:hypothetical protein
MENVRFVCTNVMGDHQLRRQAERYGVTMAELLSREFNGNRYQMVPVVYHPPESYGTITEMA